MSVIVEGSKVAEKTMVDAEVWTVSSELLFPEETAARLLLTTFKDKLMSIKFNPNSRFGYSGWKMGVAKMVHAIFADLPAVRDVCRLARGKINLESDGKFVSYDFSKVRLQSTLKTFARVITEACEAAAARHYSLVVYKLCIFLDDCEVFDRDNGEWYVRRSGGYWLAYADANEHMDKLWTGAFLGSYDAFVFPEHMTSAELYMVLDGIHTDRLRECLKEYAVCVPPPQQRLIPTYGAGREYITGRTPEEIVRNEIAEHMYHLRNCVLRGYFAEANAAMGVLDEMVCDRLVNFLPKQGVRDIDFHLSLLEDVTDKSRDQLIDYLKNSPDIFTGEEDRRKRKSITKESYVCCVIGAPFTCRLFIDEVKARAYAQSAADEWKDDCVIQLMESDGNTFTIHDMVRYDPDKDDVSDSDSDSADDDTEALAKRVCKD